MAQGDVRSALNDLQNLETDEEINELFERIKEESIFDKLKQIFKSKTFETLKNALNNIKDLEYTMLTVGENIPNEYEKKEEIKTYREELMAKVEAEEMTKEDAREELKAYVPDDLRYRRATPGKEDAG